MEATVAAIGREVRERMFRAGLSRKEAAEIVAAEYVGDENGKLRRLLTDGLLPFAFAEAESKTLRSDPISAGGGDPVAHDTQDVDEAPVRTRYSGFLANPLDAWVPIPGTGERKPLRAWTAADLTAVSRWYGEMEKTAKQKRRRFKRVAEIVGERTVGEAWSEIPEDDRRLLGPTKRDAEDEAA